MASRKKKKKGMTAAVLAGIAVLAVIFYLAGGTKEYRSSGKNEQEIRLNVAKLYEMQNAEPVDLDEAAKKRRKALLEEKGGILIDDMAAEEDKIMALTDVTNAELLKRFRNAVIVGDSIPEDAPGYGWLNTEVVHAKIGIRINADSEVINSAIAANPSVMFLVFGVNDIETYVEQANVFVDRYRAAIEKIQGALPDTVIYAHAIFPPRSLEGKSFYQYLDKYNEGLQALCEETGAYYIDSSFILKREPGYYNNDGVHMIKSFYPLWFTYLADCAGLEYDE